MWFTSFLIIRFNQRIIFSSIFVLCHGKQIFRCLKNINISISLFMKLSSINKKINLLSILTLTFYFPLCLLPILLDVYSIFLERNCLAANKCFVWFIWLRKCCKRVVKLLFVNCFSLLSGLGRRLIFLNRPKLIS